VRPEASRCAYRGRGLRNRIDTQREIIGKEIAHLIEQLQERGDLLDSIRGLLADDEAAA
jgi:hypothetical protein